MAGTASEVFIGAAWAYFGTVAGNMAEVIDLGYTKGGITVTLETSTYEILVDQEGTSPIGINITGRRAMTMVPTVQSNYERLQKLIPDSAYASERLDINSGLGVDLLDYSDELLIESKEDSDMWVKLVKAVPIVNLNASFVADAEVIWPIQFMGLVAESGHAFANQIMQLHEPS